MNNLKPFSDKLREYLKDNSKARPFVCEGNPLESRIFIVGYNAATEMKASFWEYWDDNYGFRKEKWIKKYKTNRTDAGKRNTSPTRKRIELIVEGAKPYKCLETNIYAIPTPKAEDLKHELRSTVILEFLIKEIKPTVIFVHGREAIKYMEKLASESLSVGIEKEVCLYSNRTVILARPHLSRGWLDVKAKELGVRLKELYQDFS